MKGIITIKNEGKKAKATEEKKTEEQGVELTDEQMVEVTGGLNRREWAELEAEMEAKSEA